MTSSRFSVIALASFALLAFSACDQRALVRKLTPEADDKFAQQFIFHLTGGEPDAAYASLAPSLQTPEGRKGLDDLVRLFAGGNVRSIEVIGVFLNKSWSGNANADTVSLNYQMQTNTGWFAGNVVVERNPTGKRVVGAHFNPLSKSLEEQNRFSLDSFTLTKVCILACCIASPLICLGSLVACVRSRVRKKAVWIAFIVLPITTVSMNFATGNIVFNPLSILLFGTGFSNAGPYSPWIFSFAPPIAALIFLASRKQLIKAVPPPMAPRETPAA